jgi:hypothetical protein
MDFRRLQGEHTPLRAYIDALAAALPFKLSAKHWSRWTLNANGRNYYKRRISML